MEAPAETHAGGRRSPAGDSIAVRRPQDASAPAIPYSPAPLQALRADAAPPTQLRSRPSPRRVPPPAPLTAAMCPCDPRGPEAAALRGAGSAGGAGRGAAAPSWLAVGTASSGLPGAFHRNAV